MIPAAGKAGNKIDHHGIWFHPPQNEVLYTSLYWISPISPQEHCACDDEAEYVGHGLSGESAVYTKYIGEEYQSRDHKDNVARHGQDQSTESHSHALKCEDTHHLRFDQEDCAHSGAHGPDGEAQ